MRCSTGSASSGSFTFCLDEPDRVPAFTAANDRTLAYAAENPDRIVPFVRLDLEERPIEEAERCLDLGARGIKLHPRAQKFSLGDERLDAAWLQSASQCWMFACSNRNTPRTKSAIVIVSTDSPFARLRRHRLRLASSMA